MMCPDKQFSLELITETSRVFLCGTIPSYQIWFGSHEIFGRAVLLRVAPHNALGGPQ